MRQSALTAAREGARRCACGHMRLRHVGGGQGPCVDVTWSEVATSGQARPTLRPNRCQCPGFAPAESEK